MSDWTSQKYNIDNEWGGNEPVNDSRMFLVTATIITSIAFLFVVIAAYL